MQVKSACIWFRALFGWWLVRLGSTDRESWVTDLSSELYARAACRLSRHYFEVHQLRRLSVFMRSAYGRQARKRVKCMFCVLAALALFTTVYADDRFGGSLSLDYSTFDISCGRKDHAIQFRTKEVSELCFTTSSRCEREGLIHVQKGSRGILRVYNGP
jgi:hypothetical protein